MSTFVNITHNITQVPTSFGLAFVTRKLADFIEPMRRGSPRGKIIGLNRSKYSAALVLAIFSLNSTEVSSIINVPVKLVSKWRTESQFKLTIEEIRLEYSELLLDKVLVGEIAEEDLSEINLYNLALKQELFSRCDYVVYQSDAAYLLKIWPVVKSIFNTVCAGER